MERYEYQCLTDKGGYRILTLLPAPSFSSPIQCDVLFHDITTQSETDDWEALSYTWGSQEHTGIVHLPNNKYLPVRANLESFLRHRRETDRAVNIWIDALCINQDNAAEKGAQVESMNFIYCMAPRLTIWLGPAQDDSEKAIETLSEFGSGTAFQKLPRIKQEVIRAIAKLLSRAWWSRAWIVQEVRFGTCGDKIQTAVVLCGNDQIDWMSLVIACARIDIEQGWRLQTSPAVKTVLRLDALSRAPLPKPHTDILSEDEALLRIFDIVVEFRGFQASDPRDKIYAFRGIFPPVDTEEIPFPFAYKWDTRVIYSLFAILMMKASKSLSLLRHVGRVSDNDTMERGLPSWVPDWAAPIREKPLLTRKGLKQDYIPWWSLPTKMQANTETSTAIEYPPFNEKRKRLAQDILKRSVCDEGDTMAGKQINVEQVMKRVREFEERKAQRDFLRRYLVEEGEDEPTYAAGSGLPILAGVSEDFTQLTTEGIVWDEIATLNEPFVEDILEDWSASTLFVVNLGICKQSALSNDHPITPYGSDSGRLEAFWNTIFAGQRISRKEQIKEWLPLVPSSWVVQIPPLTMLNAGSLENKERYRATIIAAQATCPILSFQVICDGVEMDAHSLEDPNWDEQTRAKHEEQFQRLGQLWNLQPFDLYHRPFQLPYVVPDPYWECRRQTDKVALRRSYYSRTDHWSSEMTWNKPGDVTRMRKLILEEAKKEPARTPQMTERADLGQYALGRRFFITKKGYFGLGPKAARKGDKIIVFAGEELPFVLRKRESWHETIGETCVEVPFVLREKEIWYEVVGEAYIDGIMRGEVVEQCKLGNEDLVSISMR